MWHGNVYVSPLVWNVLNNRSQRTEIHYEFQGLQGLCFQSVWGLESLVKFLSRHWAGLDQTQTGKLVFLPQFSWLSALPSNTQTPAWTLRLWKSLGPDHRLPLRGMQNSEGQDLHWFFSGVGVAKSMNSPWDPGSGAVWILSTGFSSGLACGEHRRQKVWKMFFWLPFWGVTMGPISFPMADFSSLTKPCSPSSFSEDAGKYWLL